MKHKLFLLVAFCLSLTNLHAQNDSCFSRSLSFLPQYVFSNGARFDYDHKLTERAWLQTSFEGYANEKSYERTIWNNEYNYELIGFGLGFHYRYYVNENVKKFGTYIAPGITVNYFKSTNSDPNTTPELASETRIWRTELNLIIGQQYKVADRLYIDFFAGLGYRQSFNHYSNESAKKDFAFNTGMFSYGFTGHVLLLGFRVGLFF